MRRLPDMPASPDAAPGQHTDKPGAQPEGRRALAGASVVVAQLPAGATSGSEQLTRMLKVLPVVSGTWGSGHLLRGTLFSALLTDDGRVVVGAVAPEALYAALAH